MSLSLDYGWWRDTASRLLDPLERLMAPGEAELPLYDERSDHGVRADRLEAFARPLYVAAHWLQAEGVDPARQARVAEWFRRALVFGTAPGTRTSWGPCTHYHQHGVELGLLCLGLTMARRWLWEPLSPTEKAQVGRWVGSVRGVGHVWNNHFFFSIFTLDWLGREGFAQPGDREAIARYAEELETMHRHGGWFMDGMNESYDHYQAFAFHYYIPWWILLFGQHDRPRAQRWAEWSHDFLLSYSRWFAASGEAPAMGRSLSYRFNCSAPFALAWKAGIRPLAAGTVRRLCRRHVEFFLEKPIYRPNGTIGYGWTDVFPALAELYSCSASVYWCAKALGPLLIPPTDPFWEGPEEPLPVESQPTAATPIPAAGLVARGLGDGAVEVVSAGTMISANNAPRYGPWKWGKLAYRTGTGWLHGPLPDLTRYPRDCALTLRTPDGAKTIGRHATLAESVTETKAVALYALGEKATQITVNLRTCLWWKGPWLLALHCGDSHQPVRLAHGGFAVGLPEARAYAATAAPGLAQVTALGQCSLVQNLLGMGQAAIDASAPDDARQHLTHPHHAVPVLETPELIDGPFVLAALWAIGPAPLTPWQILRAEVGQWHLRHPDLGDWTIADEQLPALAVG